MGILGNIKQRAVDAASNLASKLITRNLPQTTNTQPTLNEQIESDILGQRMPTVNVGPFANTLNNQINQGQMQTTTQPDFPLPGLNTNKVTNTATVVPATLDVQGQTNAGTENKKSINEQINEEKEKSKLKAPDLIGFGEKLVGDAAELINDYRDWEGEAAIPWIKSLPSRYSKYTEKAKAETDANREYEVDKKRVIKGYNATNNALYELKSIEEDTLANQIQQAYAQFENATSYEEAEAIRKKLYDDNKDYFKVEPVYGLVKRKDIDEETLNDLSNYQVNVGSYTPTESEFFTYVQNLADNANFSNNLAEKYNLKSDENVINLEDDMTKNRISNFRELAWDGLDDLATIKTKNGRNKSAFEKNFDIGLSDQINRTLTFVSPIFEEEKKILEKPANQRSEAEWRFLTEAEVTHKLWDQYARNLNDFARRELNEGTDANGLIVDALDRFAGGETLNDVLTKGMREIAMIDDIEFLGMVHASPIDIIQHQTNQAMYDYKMDVQDNAIKKGWYWLENKGERVGDWTSEILGQGTLRTLLNVGNMFTGKGKAASARYFDNDVSMLKLIETDETGAFQTLKKYSLQLGEYAPEGLANLGVDFFLYGVTGPGALTKIASNIGRIGKFTRWVKTAERVNQLRKEYTLLDKTLNITEKIGELGTKRSNINNKNKLAWNIVDRVLTQIGVGQMMDAQLSAFDTEPYSDTSFWFSVLGSLGFDMLPELKDIVGIVRSGAKGGKSLLKSAGMWDLVDFIQQSDENAMAIARALGKKYPNFSVDDLKGYVETFAEVSDAAKLAWQKISKESQDAASQWTKDLMYNYVKQTYGANSNIGRQVRQILQNKSTNPADIIKYLGHIGGTVNFGPYVSTITFKHGTPMAVTAANGDWYDVALDRVLDGGFNRRVQGGFTDDDISRIANIEKYNDLIKEKNNLFDKVGDIYYLNEKGLSRFGLKAENMTLEALGVDVAQAENVRELLKEKVKGLSNNKLTPETINALADGGGYNELVDKVKEILC